MTGLARKLGDVCERVSVGHVGKTSEYYTDESGIPFLRTQNVSSKGVNLKGVKYITVSFHEKLKKSTLSTGDLILSRVISTRINCGIIPKELDGANCANVILIRPKKELLDVGFLNHYLQSNLVQQQLLKRQVGSAQSVVNTKVLKSWKIPLPPLAEQKKIAAILDTADRLRQKDAQLIAKYNALSQSLFLDMFGDPVSNPMGWDTIHFGECLNDIIGGKSVGGEVRTIKDGEKAVLKISAVTLGHFDCLEYKVVEGCNVPNVLVFPNKGDLLFSRANTRDLVGATCIVDADYAHLFLPDKLWKLDLIMDKASAWYIKFLLTHDGFRNNLKKVATGTSGSMLNISKGKLRALSIPLPPITLQNQFAERIQAIEVQKQQAQASLQKSEDLFNSLLQRAFKGELTT